MKADRLALALDRDPAAPLRDDVIRGLRATPKRLPSKYFYDAHGSQLFEQICAQPEYYLTRTELGILAAQGRDIADAIGPRAMVIEYGSGSGIKTGRLLDALDDPVAYVPVEISPSALEASVAALADAHPQVQMLPLCADFNAPFAAPAPKRAAQRRLLFFPGSTIGNFETQDALALLRGMRQQIGAGGCALVGIDLKKDPALIEAAYNDAAGITRAFTLNLLVRLNRELGMDFDVAQFAHRARYNTLAGRIETHIESRREQSVQLPGHGRFGFGAGERMLVEYSCKYSLDEFARMAQRAGLKLTRHWSDERGWFALVLLERATD